MIPIRYVQRESGRRRLITLAFPFSIALFIYLALATGITHIMAEMIIGLFTVFAIWFILYWLITA